MQNAGYASLQIIPSFKGFQGHLERGTNPGLTGAGAKGGVVFGDAAGKSAGSRFGTVFGKAARLGLAGAVGAGVLGAKIIKDSIGAASDLNESLNAVNVTYGKQANAVQKLGQQAAESLGLSNTEFNGLAVQFSAFATQVAGGEGPKVVGVLDQLTTRGSDFASVMNLEVNEALALFQSGLAGETEPLRKFGIDLSAAAIEAHALKKGISDGKKEMTEAEKVQARYSLLMEQTAKTQGDFKNTSDSLANSQRRLSARWENAQAKLGTALLPVMEDLVGLLLDKGIPAVEKFGDWFAGKGVKHLEAFGGHAKDAAGFVKDLVGFINDIPNPAKLAGIAGVLGGGAALKLRGGGMGGGGALGAVGSALGIAKPVPVFVTNPGFGGGALGGKPGSKTPPVVPAGAPKIGGLGTIAGGLALAGGQLGQAADMAALNKQVTPDQSGLRKRILELQAAGKDVSDAIDYYEKTFDVSWDYLTVEARNALDSTAAEFKKAKIPAELKTHIALNGVPESKAEAKGLIRQYDLTPKQVRTLFHMMGYEISKKQARDLIGEYHKTPARKSTQFDANTGQALSALGRLKQEIDWVARPREARITITRHYARSGRDTYGGLQQANGGIVQAFADGGFDTTGKYVHRVPQLRRGGGAVLWNEPETGWEAYISGKPSMRARNLAILAEASRRLGVQGYAEGGMAGRAPVVRVAAPNVRVGGASVRVFLDGEEIRNIARAEIENADLMAAEAGRADW